jgi:hypothetical protein
MPVSARKSRQPAGNYSYGTSRVGTANSAGTSRFPHASVEGPGRPKRASTAARY